MRALRSRGITIDIVEPGKMLTVRYWRRCARVSLPSFDLNDSLISDAADDKTDYDDMPVNPGGIKRHKVRRENRGVVEPPFRNCV